MGVGLSRALQPSSKPSAPYSVRGELETVACAGRGRGGRLQKVSSEVSIGLILLFCYATGPGVVGGGEHRPGRLGAEALQRRTESRRRARFGPCVSFSEHKQV